MKKRRREIVYRILKNVVVIPNKSDLVLIYSCGLNRGLG